ncbi:MAG: YwaF family protein [Clostridia bacterium]|nr:YwaF family protein [Clostridia bacterium]
MKYFLDTTGTIPKGVGFSQYGLLHIVWLVIFLATLVIVSRIYKKSDSEKRAKIRKIVAWLIVADEIWKMFFLTIGGRYEWEYLPFHLCSVNIFLILWHAYKPNKVVDNFLYLVGIPGAVAAMLFPSWVKLPLFNFMHLHSFTIHTLLVLYPTMLTYAGDIKPQIKYIPKCIALLLAVCVPGVIANKLVGTNFMFLEEASAGSPLLIFENLWGNHLLGYPVLIALVILIMYGPILIKNRRKKNDKRD